MVASVEASPGAETRQQQQVVAERLFGGDSEIDPVRVDRYVILRRIGAGGMGVVYLAYDPNLDRQVAVKVIRRQIGEAAAGRMLREGRSLARLDHPNVVPVYDVGVQDGQVFVAMAYLSGQPLSAWMRDHPCTGRRSMLEILAVFEQAARGLSHAHDSDLVHRDFKPDNTFVGDNGAVRVLDFGLAAEVGEPGDEAPPTDASPATAGMTPGRLTRTGEVVGTPAYMAPEQFVGLPADQRSDQYAFCVALYEALYGRSPRPTNSAAALRRAILTDEPVPPPPAGTAVPTRLHRVLVRGLAHDPSKRYPSMEALVTALRDDPWRRFARRAAPAGVAIGLVATAAFAYDRGSASLAPCAGVDDGLVGTWDEATKDAVREAMLGTGAAYAAASWSQVESIVDGYAASWIEMRRHSCEATRVRAEQSQRRFDQRQVCFRDRQRSLAALTELLQAADAKTVERAVAAASRLPPLRQCAWDQDWENPLPRPEDPDQAAVVESIRDRLIAARALDAAGRYPASEAAIAALGDEVEAAEYPPLSVEYDNDFAMARRSAGDLTAAGARLDEAFWRALAARHDTLLADIAVRRLDVAADLDPQPVVAKWEQRARSALDRIDGDPALEASVELALGIRADRDSRMSEAIAHKRRARELRRQVTPVDEVYDAEVTSSLASSVMRDGDIPTALGLYDDAREVLLAAVGPDHPAVASLRSNVAIALLTNGDPKAAQTELEATVAVYRRAYPHGHHELANSLAVQGFVLQDLGDLDAASEAFDEALAMFRKVLRPGHPRIGKGLNAMGRLRLKQGRFAEARAAGLEALEIIAAESQDKASMAEVEVLIARAEMGAGQPEHAVPRLQRSLRLRREALGEDTPWAGEDLHALADAHAALGEFDEAIARIDEAIEVRSDAFGADDPKVVSTWVGKGDIEQQAGHRKAATTAYERAIAIIDQAGGTHQSMRTKARQGLERLAED